MQEVNVVKIETSRFGTLEIGATDCIEIKGSILGFERFRRFVLLYQDDLKPLCWFQSLDDPTLAFLVVHPHVVMPEYQPIIQEQAIDFLGITRPEEMVLLSIVTVHTHPVRITANLRAPLVINATTRKASQIILEDNRYAIQCNVEGPKPDKDDSCRGKQPEAYLANLAFPIPPL